MVVGIFHNFVEMVCFVSKLCFKFFFTVFFKVVCQSFVQKAVLGIFVLQDIFPFRHGRIPVHQWTKLCPATRRNHRSKTYQRSLLFQSSRFASFLRAK